jgi:hypothetical protein
MRTSFDLGEEECENEDGRRTLFIIIFILLASILVGIVLFLSCIKLVNKKYRTPTAAQIQIQVQVEAPPPPNETPFQTPSKDTTPITHNSRKPVDDSAAENADA